MRIAGLNHLAVVVGDLARAEAFYVGVLGADVIRRFTDERGAPRSIWVRLGAASSQPEVPFLAIEAAADLAAPNRTRRSGAPDAPAWHCVAFAIAVADRPAWRERLGAAGHPIERQTQFTLYVRDPDHNLVALSHYPEPAA